MMDSDSVGGPPPIARYHTEEAEKTRCNKNHQARIDIRARIQQMVKNGMTKDEDYPDSASYYDAAENIAVKNLWERHFGVKKGREKFHKWYSYEVAKALGLQKRG